MKLSTEHKGKTGIYAIRNKSNGKVYIGKALDIYRRVKHHITSLNTKNKDENRHLINSWHKYGKENFEYFVVEFCNTDEISERELHWIKSFDSLNREKGYNLRLDSSTGLVVSQETREKLRQAQIKRFENPEERKKCSHTFWKDNPEKLKDMGKKVAKLNVRYKIEQSDKITGQIIRIWESIIELMEVYPEYKKHNIYAVCSGEKPSMYGYKWKKIMI
jgi:group I intron endonuclease